MSNYKIMRGDIFYINKFGDAVGSEQQSGRPGIIVSNDKNNEHSATVEIVYCTTKPKEDLPTHVTIRSTNLPSTVLCEQVTTVSKERLGDYIGSCTEQEMANVSSALEISLGLDEKYSGYNPFQRGADEPDDTGKADAPKDCSADEIRIERDMYKQMYESLLNRLIPAAR